MPLPLPTTPLSPFWGPPVAQCADGGTAAAGGDAVYDQAQAAASSAGPLSPGYSDVALRDSFIEQHGQRFRFIVETHQWVTQKRGLWMPAYSEFAQAVSDHCSEVGDWYRRNGGKDGARIDKDLKHGSLHSRIERMLAKCPALVVSLNDFDTDPWLLNTPDGVIDLRELEMRPHTPDDLMRMQTAVSPQWIAQGFYQFFCPQWMEYIRFLERSDPRYVSLLRRYGALCLSGYERDLYFIFMHGEPNSGKSVFQDVLQRLLNSYIESASSTFFMRQLDKRTFELYQLKGKRGAFADEVPKNSAWDVQLLSQMFSGRILRAEGKGQAFVSFRNTAKVIVAGNHQPGFSVIERKGRYGPPPVAHQATPRHPGIRDEGRPAIP